MIHSHHIGLVVRLALGARLQQSSRQRIVPDRKAHPGLALVPSRYEALGYYLPLYAIPAYVVARLEHRMVPGHSREPAQI